MQVDIWKDLKCSTKVSTATILIIQLWNSEATALNVGLFCNWHSRITTWIENLYFVQSGGDSGVPYIVIYVLL